MAQSKNYIEDEGYGLCPHCGHTVLHRQHYVGGKGLVSFIECWKDSAHFSLKLGNDLNDSFVVRAWKTNGQWPLILTALAKAQERLGFPEQSWQIDRQLKAFVRPGYAMLFDQLGRLTKTEEVTNDNST